MPKKPYIPKYNNTNTNTPEDHVEKSIIDLRIKSKKEIKFYKELHDELEKKQNKLKEKINQSLISSANTKIEKNMFFRVVDPTHMNNPLSVYGSLKEGKRYNFGGIDGYENFPCLYLCSSAEGAMYEKFLKEFNEEGQTPSEASLIPNDSYLTSRCEVNLQKCLDIREPQFENSLKNFLDIISTIELSEKIQNKRLKLRRNIYNESKKKAGPLKTVSTMEELRRELFEFNFKQWVTFAKIPSSSQRFGNFLEKSGAEGIIYPSLKSQNETDYNIGIYPRNLKDDSYIRLLDQLPLVSDYHKKITKKNHKFFEFSEKKKGFKIIN